MIQRADHKLRTVLSVVIIGLSVLAIIVAPKRLRPVGPYENLAPGVRMADLVDTAPRDVKRLVQGHEAFSVSTDGPGPKITRVDVDNFDPKVGEMQTFSVQLNNESPVSSVSVKMQTDNGSATYELIQKSSSGTESVWEGGWKVSDTHEYIYNATVKAVADKSRQITLTFR